MSLTQGNIGCDFDWGLIVWEAGISGAWRIVWLYLCVVGGLQTFSQKEYIINILGHMIPVHSILSLLFGVKVAMENM